jgi:hypothetical protein
MLAKRYPQFVPLVTTSLKVFESVVNNGARSRLKAVGDLYNTPTLHAPNQPTATVSGTSEIDGTTLDASGESWQASFTADTDKVVKRHYVQGEADFIGRCTRASRSPQQNGLVTVRRPCEQIQDLLQMMPRRLRR